MDLVKIKKHQINFQTLQSVTNPNSIHGIYPYRGKISAKEAVNVISQFSKNKTLLDPFCGTGTIIFEVIIMVSTLSVLIETLLQ